MLLNPGPPLQVELQRKEASRAQRLLDDVLTVMGDVMGAGTQEAEQQRQEAAALLRQAFTGGAPLLPAACRLLLPANKQQAAGLAAPKCCCACLRRRAGWTKLPQQPTEYVAVAMHTPWQCHSTSSRRCLTRCPEVHHPTP